MIRRKDVSPLSVLANWKSLLQMDMIFNSVWVFLFVAVNGVEID